MIDWLDATCRSWGCCTRHLLAANASPTDPTAFPSVDAIERARPALLDLRGRGLARSSSEERMRDALLVAQAMQESPVMPLPLKTAVWVHYVERPEPVKRAGVLGRYLGRREGLPWEQYWKMIDRAHHFLLARVEPPSVRGVGPKEAA